jgi:hypothetical protein
VCAQEALINMLEKNQMYRNLVCIACLMISTAKSDCSIAECIHGLSQFANFAQGTKKVSSMKYTNL